MVETKYPIKLSVPQVSILVTVPQDQAVRLRYLCELDKQNISDLTGEALRQYLESRSHEFTDWTSINIFQPIRDKIGANLAYIRQIHGSSQTDIANAIGSWQSCISAVEQGRSGIALSDVLKICNFLGCSLEEILTGVPCGKVPTVRNNREIAIALRKFRVKNNWSQYELGLKIRCSQKVVSIIESGERALSVCEYAVLGGFLED